MSKIRVAVIFGGVSSEHDVSLVSATNVIENIPRDKYEVMCIGITKKGRWLYYPGDISAIASGEWERDPDCISAVLSPDPLHGGFLMMENGEATVRKVDVVFPVLHGKNGEDGTVQGLLALADIPCVGCGLLGCDMAFDGNNVQPGHGILGTDVEDTIRHVGVLASQGMRETDRVILKIMTE